MTDEMSDSDEDQGSDEETQPVQADSQQDRKLTRENQSLRKRLREMQDETLKARFGEDVAALIPDEVTDYDRRVALAEKWATLIKQPGSAADQAAQATDAGGTKVEPSAEERDLAAVAEGPSAAGGNPAEFATGKELFDLYKTNPQEALRIAQAKYTGR